MLYEVITGRGHFQASVRRQRARRLPGGARGGAAERGRGPGRRFAGEEPSGIARRTTATVAANGYERSLSVGDARSHSRSYNFV